MTTRHLLPIVLAGIAGTLGGVSVALAQQTPPTVKPPIATPTQSKLSDPPMTFFVATEEATACGSGCNRWIAADGKIDLAAAQRLRKLLANLDLRRQAAGHAAVAAIVEPGAGHKLPILLHSGGGSVLGAIELGRLIRSRNIEVSVARTIPAGCSRDRLHDKSCEMLKRSGKDLVSELDPGGAMCNSACVLALSGGAVRSVPPWVRLGVHAVGIDRAKTEIRGAAVVAATRAVNSRIVEFLRDMGINKALFDASNAVPHESARFLQRDELVRFGIDTRQFGEADWMFMEKPNVAIAKGFFVHTPEANPAYREALLRLDCGAGRAMRLTFVRERGASNRFGDLRSLGVRVNGSRIDLPYAARSGKMEIRTTDPTDLWSNVIDSVDDKSALEIFGFEPDLDSEPPDRIVLNMAGFSAAYAKLRKACDDSSSVDRGCSVGDLSPRCMPDALRSWRAMPSTPDGQTASPRP